MAFCYIEKDNVDFYEGVHHNIVPMAKKYPEIPVPNKVLMPRPVDEYFKKWERPKRPEFWTDIDMSEFTGNQKWQMCCWEKFLEMNE